MLDVLYCMKIEDWLYGIYAVHQSPIGGTTDISCTLYIFEILTF